MGSAGDGDRSVVNYPFYGSGNWDPIVSLSQSGDFVSEFANPHLVHIPSDPSLVDMLPKISSTFSSSMGQISESGRDYPDFALRNGVGSQRALVDVTDSQEHGLNSEDGLLGSSPYGKRKRKVPIGPSLKNGEEQQKAPSGDTSKSPIEGDGKKKPAAKHAPKDNSAGAEPSKDEEYIHMRAKRGQATNSHSLAERVRREKISERMRLLQDLVPGCNKITGKALMLDEIINYVQSLQQQVEFLSMKLATVNPELNVNIDTILSKDILHLHGSNPATLGISSGYPQSTFHGTTQFHPIPPHIWNNELHGILQMELDRDHDHDPSVTNLGPNGQSKMEL